MKIQLLALAVLCLAVVYTLAGPVRVVDGPEQHNDVQKTETVPEVAKDAAKEPATSEARQSRQQAAAEDDDDDDDDDDDLDLDVVDDDDDDDDDDDSSPAAAADDDDDDDDYFGGLFDDILGGTFHY